MENLIDKIRTQTRLPDGGQAWHARISYKSQALALMLKAGLCPCDVAPGRADKCR